jgi:hypothetical protein
MMGSLGSGCYKPSFVISTGDNFYSHGLKGPDDPYFKQTFSDMYSAPSLQVPWYAVLGNHDYGEANAALLWACASPSFDTCPKDCCLSAAWQVRANCQWWATPGGCTCQGVLHILPMLQLECCFLDAGGCNLAFVFMHCTMENHKGCWPLPTLAPVPRPT